ncbi:MAG: hypothetical protein Q9174_000356 [Haloplaca sp. 1 TL-2023]
MSGQAANAIALSQQIAELERIVKDRPDNAMARKTLNRCMEEYEECKPQPTRSRPQREDEKPTPVVGKSITQPTSSISAPRPPGAEPTHREQSLYLAQSKREQARRTAVKNQAYLDDLTAKRSAVLTRRHGDGERRWYENVIEGARRAVRTSDNLVLAAEERVVRTEKSVREAKAKAKKHAEAQEHRQSAEQPSTIGSVKDEEPGHKVEPKERVKAEPQPGPTKPVDEPAHPVDQSSHQVGKISEEVRFLPAKRKVADSDQGPSDGSDLVISSKGIPIKP